MAFKWSKGQAHGNKNFSFTLPRALSPLLDIQKMLTDFFQSVAMKTDLGFLRMFDGPSEYGDPGAALIMNNDGDGIIFEGQETIDSLEEETSAGLSCATMAINVAALADDTDLNMDTSGWAAVYDPDSWVTPTKGITAPTDGVYIIKAYSECELYYDSEEHNATAIAFNRLYLYHNDSSDVLVKLRHCYHYIVTQFTKFYGPTSWNSETEEYSYDHIGFGEIVNSDYGNCHIYAVVEMSAGDYIEVEFLHQNEPFDVTAEVDIELSMVRIKDLS